MKQVSKPLFVIRFPNYSPLLILFLIGLCPLATTQGQSQTELQGLSSILRFGGVSRDLEMTEQQAYDLDDLWIEIKDETSQALQVYKMEKSGATSQDELKKARTKFENAIEKVLQKEAERIDDVLLPAQVERLKQIRIQILQNQAGGLSLLANELDLSSRQKRQFQEFQKESRQNALEVVTQIRSKEMTQKDGRQAIKEIGEGVKAKFLELLTSQQRDELRTLEGEPFEFQTNEVDDSEQSDQADGKSDDGN